MDTLQATYTSRQRLAEYLMLVRQFGNRMKKDGRTYAAPVAYRIENRGPSGQEALATNRTALEPIYFTTDNWAPTHEILKFNEPRLGA